MVQHRAAGRQMLALHQLTVMDAPSVGAFARIAAGCGYDAIDLFVRFREGPWPTPPMIGNPQELRALRRQLADDGLSVHNLESFLLVPDFDFDDFDRKLEMGASLGARRATVFLVDPEPARREDGFVRAAAVAARYGIELGLEAAPISLLIRLQDIAAFIDRTGVTNAACVVDLLHHRRNGQEPADIAATAAHIGSAQIMDAPASLPEASPDPHKLSHRMYEAMLQRQLPGEGALPVAACLAALPSGIPLSIEIPDARAQAAGRGPAERAARALAAVRALLP